MDMRFPSLPATRPSVGGSRGKARGADTTGSSRDGGVTTARPFGRRDRMGYFCGGFANGAMFLFTGTWFVIFYTKVIGVPAVVAGAVFLAVRLLDAFIDVAVGVTVDRAADRPAGKFRSVMMRFAGPLALCAFLLFQSFTVDAPLAVRVAYMALTYLAWGLCYSLTNIPFGSLASSVSDDSRARTSLSTARSVGASAATLLVSVGVPLVVYAQGGGGAQVIRGGAHTQVFTIAAGVVALLSFAGYLLCYLGVVERVRRTPPSMAEGSRSGLRLGLRMVRTVLSSHAMAGILLCALCLLTAQLLGTQLLTLVYADYFGNAKLASLSAGVGVVAIFVVAPFVGFLTERFGRRALAMGACGLGALSMLGLFFLQTRSVIVFMALAVMHSVALLGFNLVVWAMIADAADNVEAQSGARQEATCFSCYAFARKVGQALAGGIAGVALSAVGYQGGADAAQSALTVQGMYSVSTLVPGVFFVLALAALLFVYPTGRARAHHNVVDPAR